MRAADLLGQAGRSLAGHRLRTGLIVLGTATGVAAVVLLGALGDGARRYVIGEFSALGTNLVIVLPGRTETTGGPPPLFGETPRDLTLDDALALTRSPHVRRVAPVVVGAAPVAWGNREREVNVLGSTAELRPVRHLGLGQGRFLPELDPHRAAPVCVLGETLRRELFGATPALGQWLRIGEHRFRVVGVTAPSGVSIGVDLDDNVIVPVAAAQAIFDTPALFRILVEARSPADIAAASADVRSIIASRHEGEDDVTIITQDSVIATFDRILGALTMAVAGIAGTSLLVAGILIMNVMLVAVTQRRAEIGLLKALGATRGQVRALFVVEAVLLSAAGSGCGLAVGALGAEVLHRLYPVAPIAAPLWAYLAAAAAALGTGVGFGVLPAARAARLDPIAALARR